MSYSSASGLSDYDPSSYNRRGGRDRKKGKDSYDFDMSDDFADSPVIPTRRGRETSYENVATSRYGATRRSSVDDRAQEILRNRTTARAAEEVGGHTLTSEYAELMEGISLPDDDRSTFSASPSPSLLRKKSSSSQHLLVLSPEGEGDSLDISAADLEVGTFAARKLKEKQSERRRRMSFDQPAGSALGLGPRPSLLMASAALSSIQGERDYGSVERSDDEIYKMLNLTAAASPSASSALLLRGNRAASDMSDMTFEAEAEADGEEYEEDFEEAVTPSHPLPPHPLPTPLASPVAKSLGTSSVVQQQAVDLGALNSVEQIMQSRWAEDHNRSTPSGVQAVVPVPVSVPSSPSPTPAPASAPMPATVPVSASLSMDPESPVFPKLHPLVPPSSLGPSSPPASPPISRSPSPSPPPPSPPIAPTAVSVPTAAPVSTLDLPSWGSSTSSAEKEEVEEEVQQQSSELPLVNPRGGAARRSSRYTSSSTSSSDEEVSEEVQDTLAELRSRIRDQDQHRNRDTPTSTPSVVPAAAAAAAPPMVSKGVFSPSVAAKLRRGTTEEVPPKKMTRRAPPRTSSGVPLARKSADLQQHPRGSVGKGENVFVTALLEAVRNIQQGPQGQQEQLLGAEAEGELKAVVRELMQDVSALRLKEREVAAREKAVVIKEAMLSARDEHQQHPSSTSWEVLQQQLLATQAENDQLRAEAEAAQAEADGAKARAFEAMQAHSLSDRAERRSAQGLGAGEALAPLEALLAAAQHSQAYRRLAARVPTGPLGTGQTPQLAQRGTATTQGVEELLSVPRADLQELLKDYATQERLLDGFHKENVLLAQRIKEREREASARNALHLDQMDEANKLLNRCQGQGQGRASLRGEQLRGELELDAKARYLQEQLAEVREEAGQRERQLQNTVSGLRAELSRLQRENQQLQSADMQQMAEALGRAQAEGRRLEDKLRWHLDNQRLVNERDEEAARLKKQLQVMKQEVLRRGASAKQVAALLDPSPSPSAHAHSDALDRTADSIRSNKQLPSARSFQDVKRIKELEGAVRDLQDALAKRYPDSVVGLIHAAKMSDLAEEKAVKLLEQQVQDLKAELADAQQGYERKVRAIRQEFEEFRSAAAAAAHKTVIPVPPAAAVPKLEGSAQRVAELEAEVASLRRFYKGKLDDLQRRHDQQLRALKRGDELAPPPPPPLPDQRVAELYKQRIAMLESELDSAAQEIGSLKAKLLTAPPPPPPPASVQPNIATDALRMEDVEAMVAQRVQQAVAQVIAQLPAPAPVAAPAAPIPPPAETPIADLSRIYRLWLEEKDKFIVQLREERVRNEALTNEIAQLQQRIAQLSAEASKLKTPTLLSFQVLTCCPLSVPTLYLCLMMTMMMQSLEQQLRDMEGSLQRRERELLGAMEDCKMTAKMDMQRMQMYHGQEIQQKNDEFAELQGEMQFLVVQLQQCRLAIQKQQQLLVTQ